MTVRTVISALGGITRLSKALGHRHPTTVQGWWQRSTIPALRQRDVLRLAEDLGIPITATDLLADEKTEAASGA